MALSPCKCQSNCVSNVKIDGDAIAVEGSAITLTYRPREILLSDGRRIAHESQGGELNSVWATDLGDCYVEVVHLGDGPTGGELVLVVPGENVVVIGDLYPGDNLADVHPSWAGALDLTIGLTNDSTTILTSLGTVTRDQLDASHQRILGILNG